MYPRAWSYLLVFTINKNIWLFKFIERDIYISPGWNTRGRILGEIFTEHKYIYMALGIERFAKQNYKLAISPHSYQDVPLQNFLLNGHALNLDGAIWPEMGQLELEGGPVLDAEHYTWAEWVTVYSDMSKLKLDAERKGERFCWQGEVENSTE